MFALALEAKARGMGVVGSTQNILDFIAGKLSEALERPFPERLQARCHARLRLHCVIGLDGCSHGGSSSLRTPASWVLVPTAVCVAASYASSKACAQCIRLRGV